MFFLEDPEAKQIVYHAEFANLADLVGDYKGNKIAIIKWIRMAMGDIWLKDAKEYYERYSENPPLLLESFYCPSDIHEEEYLRRMRLLRSFRNQVINVKASLDELMRLYADAVLPDEAE